MSRRRDQTSVMALRMRATGPGRSALLRKAAGASLTTPMDGLDGSGPRGRRDRPARDGREPRRLACRTAVAPGARVGPVTRPSPQPVFVVGGPRSGTTLLSAMLAAHPAFDCGPETHCLSRWARLGRRERARILDPADWPAPRHRLRDQPLARQAAHPPDVRPDARGRPRLAGRPAAVAGRHARVAHRAARAARRARRAGWRRRRATSRCRSSSSRPGRGRASLRIVRDPRDAAVSLTRVPFGTPSLLTNLSVLARMNEAAADFYRDLAAGPHRALRGPRGRAGAGAAAHLRLRGRAVRRAHARGPQRGQRRRRRARVVEGRCHRAHSTAAAPGAGARRCPPRCSTTSRSTWATCSRSTATARRCRPPASWPSCRPGTP